MSGETEQNVSGWTVDTLKAYFDEIIDRETHRIDARFEREHNFILSLSDERRRAQDKFESGVTARFSQVNEFRGSLDDLGKTMATRRELTTATDALVQRLDAQQLQIGELRSRLDVGPAGLGQVQAYQQQQAGRQAGIGEVIAVVVAAVTVTSALIGIIVVLANVLTKG